MERHDEKTGSESGEMADDVDGWTDEPGDPDQAGPAAEFVDEPLIDRPESPEDDEAGRGPVSSSCP